MLERTAPDAAASQRLHKYYPFRSNILLLFVLAFTGDAPEALTRLLGEGAAIFVETVEALNHPHLRRAGDAFDLVVEGVVVLTNVGAADGLLLWGVSFFVLDQKCPKVTKNTCWFLRKHVLGIGLEDARPDSDALQEVDALTKMLGAT